MKIILTESQFNRILSEQVVKGVNSTTLTPTTQTSFLEPTTNVASGTYNSTLGKSGVDIHTELAILQIATAFIPEAGIYVSAGIGLIDAGIYYNEGDKTMAAVTAALAAIPLASQIPGVKEVGKRVMSAIIGKIIAGVKLTNTELQAVKVIGANKDLIIKELATGATKLEPVVGSVKSLKPNFIAKFGQQKYDKLLQQFLSNEITKEGFVNSLKSAGGETYKLANWAVQSGIKFSQTELKSLSELIPHINDGKYARYFVKLNVKGVTKEVEVIVDYLPKKDWEGLAVGQNKIYMNTAKLAGKSEQEIGQTLFHEAGHIKDPSRVSPKLNKSYKEIMKAKDAAGEKSDKLYSKAMETKKIPDLDAAINANKEFGTAFKKYVFHPQEIVANNQMVLNNMTTELDNVIQDVGSKGAKKVLDNLIGYTSGKNPLSKEALELLGKDGAAHLEGLNKYNKKNYQDFLKKLAKQSEYLKSQLNLIQ